MGFFLLLHYILVYYEKDVVHLEENAIAIFTENNLNGEQIFIAYFVKENGQWAWRHASGSEWDTPINWSSMQQKPYIYSGAISDNTIVEVYAGNNKASIIQVEDNKRFWYVISDKKTVDVKYIKNKGSEEYIERISR